MKVEARLFVIATVFYVVTTIIYWGLSREIVGTTALALTAGLAFLVAFYLLFTGSRVGARPEDRADAEISDADPDYGFFSPYSWWPLPVGFSIALIALGLIFAAWIVMLGVVLLMSSLVGFYFEYYRGAFAD